MPRLGGSSTGTSLGKSIVLSQIDGTILARTISRNVNALGRQQPEASVASDLQGVNVEICVEIVRRLHDRRRRRHDDETTAFADPVDIPMPVHEDTSLRHRLQAAQEPIAVDEGRSDALRQNLCRARILDRMVVEPDEPAGPRRPVSANLVKSAAWGLSASASVSPIRPRERSTTRTRDP